MDPENLKRGSLLFWKPPTPVPSAVPGCDGADKGYPSCSLLMPMPMPMVALIFQCYF